MNAVSAISTRVIAIATASAISGCAIPTSETWHPFQEPWPWTKIVTVNRTDHDVLALRAGPCETGPASWRSLSAPSFCFLGTKPEGPIAITWSDAIAGTESHAASEQGELLASTAPLPRLWREKPHAGEAIGNFLCVVLRNDARVDVAVTASAEACAVL
ncbi:Lipoprotein [Cupriavidus necator H16]|uniref:Hypothetical membrane associated protein n=1 Tax=Cupriavidus necator (strain ATCC 17699 / DSM 428 / KCTC 22496 / NCIMB 10442 / H16 / Stanier 337) TaxID=381666 RepID=Q0K0R5_CUPNH|nr:hypothetical protein [Cupriavidus necator]QCC04247.1 hypothetical protein E6A55_27390 [Cupriavidus necator H16]QQB78935.1 hypothetical protein I6H87_26975 [Cupriavidus necator]WKA43153.1 hypothetical protein QWP09_27450 [Cupriavidus necator]CAJ96409.1 hypothetical membrane associated protein [Cupriavidus necator H16]